MEDELGGRAKPTYRFLLNSTLNAGNFRPYIAFFNPKKRDIENSPYFLYSYNAHLTPKNVHIAPFRDGILSVYHLITNS